MLFFILLVTAVFWSMLIKRKIEMVLPRIAVFFCLIAQVASFFDEVYLVILIIYILGVIAIFGIILMLYDARRDSRSLRTTLPSVGIAVFGVVSAIMLAYRYYFSSSPMFSTTYLLTKSLFVSDSIPAVRAETGAMPRFFIFWGYIAEKMLFNWSDVMYLWYRDILFISLLVPVFSTFEVKSKRKYFINIILFSAVITGMYFCIEMGINSSDYYAVYGMVAATGLFVAFGVIRKGISKAKSDLLWATIYLVAALLSNRGTILLLFSAVLGYLMAVIWRRLYRSSNNILIVMLSMVSFIILLYVLTIHMTHFDSFRNDVCITFISAITKSSRFSAMTVFGLSVMHLMILLLMFAYILFKKCRLSLFYEYVVLFIGTFIYVVVLCYLYVTDYAYTNIINGEYLTGIENFLTIMVAMNVGFLWNSFWIDREFIGSVKL